MLKKEHDRLSKEIKAIGAALSAFGAVYGNGTAPRGRMSAAGRARIAAAQRARWAKVKASSENEKVVTMPKKRTMSASARKKIAAAPPQHFAMMMMGHVSLPYNWRCWLHWIVPGPCSALSG
jgi:hypothetical protein